MNTLISRFIPCSFQMGYIYLMKYYSWGYRFAGEIFEHANYQSGYRDILRIVQECPLFLFPNKSRRNSRLDVVQQLMNTYFDRRFTRELGWEYHPNATTIPDSELKADFRSTYGDPAAQTDLKVQTEVQLGNMARWYSDIFKFQTAYSQGVIDMGLSIVPMASLARRIDSNVVNFERCRRELPSAKLSITLPILMIGLEVDETTASFDVSRTAISSGRTTNIVGEGRTHNRYRIVHGILNRVPLEQITETSPTGPMPSSTEDTADLEDQEL